MVLFNIDLDRLQHYFLNVSSRFTTINNKLTRSQNGEHSPYPHIHTYIGSCSMCASLIFETQSISMKRVLNPFGYRDQEFDICPRMVSDRQGSTYQCRWGTWWSLIHVRLLTWSRESLAQGQQCTHVIILGLFVCFAWRRTILFFIMADLVRKLIYWYYF